MQGVGWSAISSSVSSATDDRTRSRASGSGEAERLHLHRLLDAVLAGRQELPLALDLAPLLLGDLDHAEPADGHRVHVVAVAEDRDRIALGRVLEERRRRVVDRGGAGDRPALRRP